MKDRFQRLMLSRIASHGLFVWGFWGNAKIRETLLKILHNVFPHSFNVCRRDSSRRDESGHLVHKPLKNSHSKLQVDDGIGEVETSNANAHSNLGLWGSGCSGCLGGDIPRLRVFFVNLRRNQ